MSALLLFFFLNNTLLILINIFTPGLVFPSLGSGAVTCIPVINTISHEWQFIATFIHSFTLQIFMEHLQCAGWEKHKKESEDWKGGSLCIKGWMPCLGHSRWYMPFPGQSSEAFHRSCNSPSFLSPPVITGRSLAGRIKRSMQPASGSHAWRTVSCRDTRFTAHADWGRRKLLLG